MDIGVKIKKTGVCALREFVMHSNCRGFPVVPLYSEVTMRSSGKQNYFAKIVLAQHSLSADYVIRRNTIKNCNYVLM